MNSIAFGILLHALFLLPSGKASGELYEDDGDGFAYQNGDYLITHYEAEKVSNTNANNGEVLIRVASTEGYRERPKRTLKVRVLVGENVQVLERLLLV